MSFGSRLKEKRESLGITQPKLAEMLGVSKGAIGNWETDVNSPRAAMLYDLFKILHCDANYLFQDNASSIYRKEASPEEFENIIQKYRKLDEHGKEMVDFTLNKEYERSIQNVNMGESLPYSSNNFPSAARNNFTIEKNSNIYGANAAHLRTDIDIDEDTDISENDIMDDKDF